MIDENNAIADEELPKASEEEQDWFDELIKEACLRLAEKELQEFDSLDVSDCPPPSRRNKTRMNRIFRERVGGSFIPFPDVDNPFERLRSKLVVKFKINDRLDRKKQRKCS